jgi:16S rRNA processing protein RimM
VKVGYVRRAHGVRGAVIVRVLGDETGQYVPDRALATDHAAYPIVTVDSAAPHKDGMLVSFRQLADRNQAEQLRGTSLFIDASERRVLDEDEYWPEQLIGLAVMDGGGERLGVVTGSVPGAQDRLVVTTADGEREVPFVAAIVVAIDLDAGFLVVDPPAGLL